MDLHDYLVEKAKRFMASSSTIPPIINNVTVLVDVEDYDAPYNPPVISTVDIFIILFALMSVCGFSLLLTIR